MLARRGWFLGLGAVGAAAILYVLVVRTVVAPGAQPGAGLGWLLFGTLPLYAFGMWLLTATSSRVAVYVALGGTGSAVGSAYETFVWTNQDVVHSSTFALVNQVGLAGDALSAVGWLLMIATFPDGALTHRWQRVALRFVWLNVLSGPLTLVTHPHVQLPAYLGLDLGPIANPYYVAGLAPLRSFVDTVLLPWFVIPGLALVVFYARVFFDPPERRAQMRFIGVAVTLALVMFSLWETSTVTGIDGTPFATATTLGVAVSMILLPVAGIHGILRHGAFDVAARDRGRLVVKSSGSLITILYVWAVAGPGVLLSQQLPTVTAVLVTTAIAAVLLPVRAWLARRIHRLVFGDRDEHLTLLADLGGRLEQSVDVDEVLARLATAVRDGLGASWVRIRLVGPEGHAAAARATAGQVSGEPVMGLDLTQGDTVLGRIDVGPARSGSYSATQVTLLETVTRQATTAVANVRLTAALADQLAALTASRTRLITAQDEERRRIERDLHDGVQQSVVALIASLRLARNRLDRGELRSEELTDLQDQAREVLADLRELAHGIHPQVLSDRGLVAAVESRTARFPVPLTVEADEAARTQRFGTDLETVAFYTIREALANVAKHAGATSARVRLGVTDGALVVEVADDGAGFDPGTSTARADEGAGLANMRDRVAAVGGRLHLDSAEGSGTRLVVELPLPRAGAGDTGRQRVAGGDGGDGGDGGTSEERGPAPSGRGPAHGAPAASSPAPSRPDPLSHPDPLSDPLPDGTPDSPPAPPTRTPPTTEPARA